MNYWTQSFGYYLIWPVIITYIITMTVAIILDIITLKKIRKKVENIIIEVQVFNEEDPSIETKDKLLDDHEEEKRLDPTLNGSSSNKDSPKSQDEKDVPPENNKVAPKGKADETYETSDTLDIYGENYFKSSPKKKRMLKKKKKKPTNIPGDKAEMEGGETIEEEAEIDKPKQKMPKEEEKIPDMTKNGNGKLPKKKKKIKRKKKKTPSEISPSINSPPKSKEPNNNKIDESKNEDSVSEPSKSENKSSGGTNPDNEEYDEMENKYRMPSQLEIFEKQRSFKQMFFYSSTFTNTIFVTSYLCPRHIRVSMLFTNLVLIWFLVAVFFNNTKDPLIVPNFDRQARNLAFNEMWIALIAPLVTMSTSYIFWGIFMISDARFHQKDSYVQVKDGTMVKSLLKEMYLRFFMAYFVMAAIFGAIMWYVVEFTAKFGWKVSWTWWYSGSFAFFFNY